MNVSQPGNWLYHWDHVEVSCSVNFSGTWKPVFHCILRGNNSPTAIIIGGDVWDWDVQAYNYTFVYILRPVESQGGVRETIIAGPYQPYSICAEIETPKASRGREHGKWCPFTIRLGVWESVVSFPSGVRAENGGFYAYLRSERSHLEHSFQYFFERCRGPQTTRGP